MTTNNETDIIAASTIPEIGLAVPRSVSVTPEKPLPVLVIHILFRLLKM